MISNFGKLCDGKFVGPDGVFLRIGTVIVQPNFFEACETLMVYLLSVFGFDVYQPTGVIGR